MHDFLGKILYLAVKHKLSITSWIRSEKRNVEVGGHDSSLHMLALAVDIVLDYPDETNDFVRDAERLGLRAIDMNSHIHVQINRI